MPRTRVFKSGNSQAAGPATLVFKRRLRQKFIVRWMVDRSPEALEPTVGRVKKTAAFNMTVLCQILGTPLQPDLDGHVLMLEEVGEAMYRIDRSLFQRRNQARVGRHAWPLRRYHLERARFRNERGGDRPLLVPQLRNSMVGMRRRWA
jgi:hypothetical protein